MGASAYSHALASKAKDGAPRLLSSAWDRAPACGRWRR